MHVEIEQWPGFSTRFVHDEAVECVVLKLGGQPMTRELRLHLLEE